MTTITLEVPDELATQLNSVGNHLPALLYETLKSRAGEKTAGLLKSGALRAVKVRGLTKIRRDDAEAWANSLSPRAA